MTYFAPPRRVETSVFSRLPDKFRTPHPIVWADANQGRRAIDCFLLDPASGNVAPFPKTAASESFGGANDLALAPLGTLYFTDQGQTGMHGSTGRMWKLTPKGRLTCLVDAVPTLDRVVFITESRAGTIRQAELDTPGLPMFSRAG